MQHSSQLIDQVRSWERDICDAIDQVQTISHNEKNSLHLYLETHPLPFQPSPVLLQLLQNDRRRRSSSSGHASFAKQSKQQLKSADYLDRKFESEIRQHYELENAQNCGKWKQFHFRASEACRQLASGIERDFRQFCHQLGTSGDETLQPNEQHRDDDNQRIECSPSPLPGGTTATKAAMSIEDTLRLHLAQEWVQQERFNIQEAFTNQSWKLQEDLDAFLDQQETAFLEERRKILSTSTPQSLQPQNELVARKHHHRKARSQFQSNAKRGMLLQTSSPLPVEPTANGEERIMQWRGATAGSRLRSSLRSIRSDVDETQDKLDELQRRLQIRKEVDLLHVDSILDSPCLLKIAAVLVALQAAEAKRKDGMQSIGRQCAHMFAQLDCKETEAAVVAMLIDEELTQIGSLRRRASEIANGVEKLTTNSAIDGLPQLSTSRSETRLLIPLKAKKYMEKPEIIQLNRK